MLTGQSLGTGDQPMRRPPGAARSRRARWFTVAAWLALSAGTAGQSGAPVTLSSADLAVRIDARGQLVGLRQPSSGRELLAPEQPAPILQIRVGTRVESPAAMVWNARAGVMALRYAASGATVWVETSVHPTHVTLSITRVDPVGLVDAVTWGPYPVTIGETVGEIIGVVRDQSFAVGLQVLNIKTLGGIPAHDEGSDPSRSRVAQAAPWGSVLQAYALDRSRPRRVSGWTGQFPEHAGGAHRRRDGRRIGHRALRRAGGDRRWIGSAQSKSPKACRIRRSTASG